MAVSLNSVVGFNSTLQSRDRHVSISNNGAPVLKAFYFVSPLGLYGSRKTKTKRQNLCHSVSNSDRVATEANDKNSGNAERSVFANQLSSVSSSGNSQLHSSSADKLKSEIPETSNGLGASSEINPENSSPELRSTLKSTPLTARERLRAARVLSRYTETKASKSKLGSSVIDALTESDKKGKRRSGLPEAPTNLLDDSKRGMPKPGWTFEFPGGVDLFVIAFSFVFISTVMFATTYLVWKLGAIHFNEY